MRLVVLLAILSSGCVAASIKAHAGGVTSDAGSGVQAGLVLGIGIAGKRGAVISSVGIAGGDAPGVGLAAGVDYLLVPRRSAVGWRLGLGGVQAFSGAPSTMGLRVATLFPIFDRVRSGGGKMFSSSNRTLLAAGVEGTLGVAFDGGDDGRTRALGGGAALTLELDTLNRMW